MNASIPFAAILGALILGLAPVRAAESSGPVDRAHLSATAAARP